MGCLIYTALFILMFMFIGSGLWIPFLILVLLLKWMAGGENR